MDINKYSLPRKPIKTGVIHCPCGHDILLKGLYKFCPMCGKSCMTLQEADELYTRQKESYNFQVNEIRKTFIQDLADEFDIDRDKPICFTFDRLIEYAFNDSGERYEDVYDLLNELLTFKK